MKKGTRALLQGAKRRTVDVEIADLDATFTLREMSGTERDSFEIGIFKEGEDGNRTVEPRYLRARLVALCLIGDDGKRLYSDEEISDLSDAVPASVLSTLFAAAQKLNGLDADAVKTAAKNSASAPAGGSPSA